MDASKKVQQEFERILLKLDLRNSINPLNVNNTHKDHAK